MAKLLHTFQQHMPRLKMPACMGLQQQAPQDYSRHRLTIFTTACMSQALSRPQPLLYCVVLTVCTGSRYFVCMGGSTAHAAARRAMVRYLL